MNPAVTASFAFRFQDGVEIRLDKPVSCEASRVTVLFGPSGAGKTTVLRCLAGLLRPHSGTIIFGTQTWFDASSKRFLPARQRKVGFVPQDYALFPHISVERNLAYGLAGWRQSDREARIAELVDWLGLGGLEHRLPGELSGGQKQRVALGRAVASRPSLLLLDEPLAALDLPTRSRLRNELRQLLKQVDAATVLVTHDRSDALALADHVVVIDNGKVLQQGPPATVFDRPETHAVAGIVSIETIQPGIIVESGDLTTVTVGAQKLVAAKTALSPGAKSVFVCIRAEDVLLVKGEPPKTSSRNSLPSIVRDLIAEGPMMRVELDCGFPLKALLTRQACNELGLQKGSQLLALIKAPNVHLVERAWPTDR